jgi:hypothetical protein
VLNHLRYQALERAFGVSREQANVLTFVLLATAADGAFEAARWVGRLRPHVSRTDAAIGAIALRDVSLSIAGPSVRNTPAFGSLVAFAVVGGLAAPGLRRAVRRMRATEQRLRATEARVRHERIQRYAAARDRTRANVE